MVITIDVLRRAAELLLNKGPMRYEPLIVHPLSKAWAQHPEGDPPSDEALAVALRFGTVTPERAREEGWL